MRSARIRGRSGNLLLAALPIVIVGSSIMQENKVQALISQLAQAEPAFHSLGTPVVADTDATRALVRIGRPAVPLLIAALDAPDAKMAMYAAYCLGQIQDSSAISALAGTKSRFEGKEPKGPYDFGVISAVNRALEQLAGSIR
jgi:HEAT repeat protein